MNNDKIILVRGDKSNWYEQAIFIMKSGVPKNKVPLDLVAEAERIINKCAYSSLVPSPVIMEPGKTMKPAAERQSIRANSGINKTLNVLLLIGCSVLAGMVLYALLR